MILFFLQLLPPIGIDIGEPMARYQDPVCQIT